MKNAKLDWLTDPFWFTKTQFSSQERLKTRVEKVSAVVQMQQDEIIRHDLSHLMQLKEVEDSHEEALRDLNRKFDKLLMEKNEENRTLEQKIGSSIEEANAREEHLSQKLKRVSEKLRVTRHQLGTKRTDARKQFHLKELRRLLADLQRDAKPDEADQLGAILVAMPQLGMLGASGATPLEPSTDPEAVPHAALSRQSASSSPTPGAIADDHAGGRSDACWMRESFPVSPCRY